MTERQSDKDERAKRVSENGTVSTAYAALLNALVDMQASPAYAVRRSVLEDAERTIIDLERKLSEETRNKKQFERDWLEACDQVVAVRPECGTLPAAAPTPRVDAITMRHGEGVILSQQQCTDQWNDLLREARQLERELAAAIQEGRRYGYAEGHAAARSASGFDEWWETYGRARYQEACIKAGGDYAPRRAAKVGYEAAVQSTSGALSDADLWTMVRVYGGWKTDEEMVEAVGYSLELYIEKMRRAVAAVSASGALPK